jgi:nitrite reductase (NO-forming)
MRLHKKIHEWYVLEIGLCVMVVVFLVASAPRAAPPPTEWLHESQTAQYDHDMQDMAASEPSKSVTTGQAPAIPASSTAVADGDAAAGRQVFRKCQACHSMEPGKNLLGPSLAGVIGRKAGGESGYNYSLAIAQAGIVWDTKTLDAYLADPAKTIPGNKMPFPGLKTEHDRKDVIAFLASAGGASVGTPGAAGQQPPAPSGSAQQAPAAAGQAQQGPSGADIGYIPDAKYTLRSGKSFGSREISASTTVCGAGRCVIMN